MIDENNENQKHSKRSLIFSVIAAVVFIVYIIASLAFSTALKVTYLIDFIGFNEVVVITLLMLISAGRFGAFCRIFKYSIRKCDDIDTLKEAIETASYTIKSLFIAAGITNVLYFIAFMTQLNDLETIGPNLAVMILGWLYAVVLEGIILVLQERLKRKLK